MLIKARKKRLVLATVKSSKFGLGLNYIPKQNQLLFWVERAENVVANFLVCKKIVRFYGLFALFFLIHDKNKNFRHEALEIK